VKAPVLQIAKDLALPLDAVTQKLAWLGRTGSGKTYGAKRMVEQMLHAGAQVVILDPVGVWPGLRLGPKAFDVPVLGGLFGDIPLERTAGALIADLVVNHATSMVIDVSQMLDNERTRFAQAFGERFFQRKKAEPGAVHLVIEECQEFIPQNHQHGEERMLHEFQRIAKLGRNFGIGLSLISQRPQEVNKKALNQAECVLAFQMTGPQERKALEYWLSDKGFDGKLSEILPRLEVGAPHVWSPQWLKISKVVKILPIDSLDTSQTPKVGDKSFRQRKLEPIDLKALTEAMKTTLERAKADDPEMLRARIAELEQELEDAQQAAPAAEPERVEVPVFDEVGFAEMRALARLAGQKVADDLAAAGRALDEAMQAFCDRMRAHAATRTTIAQTSPPVVHRDTNPEKPLTKEVTSFAQNGSRPVGIQKATNGAVTGGELAILTAVAQHRAGCTREQLTVLTGYKRSSRDTFIQRLSSAGRIDKDGDRLVVTDRGRADLGPDFKPLPKGAALRQFWLDKLGGGERVLLEQLVKAYPKPLTRTELSERTDYQRSSRDTFLQRLSSRELVGARERRASGGARASGCGYPRNKQPFGSERELGVRSWRVRRVRNPLGPVARQLRTFEETPIDAALSRSRFGSALALQRQAARGGHPRRRQALPADVDRSHQGVPSAANGAQLAAISLARRCDGRRGLRGGARVGLRTEGGDRLGEDDRIRQRPFRHGALRPMGPRELHHRHQGQPEDRGSFGTLALLGAGR